VQLRQFMNTREDDDFQIIAISADPLEETQAFSKRMELNFPLLSDPDLEVINRYGVYHEDEPDGRKIARPSIFVIDHTGIIRYHYIGQHYDDRPPFSVLTYVLDRVMEGSK
jgi:peroxiredoxin Q/BCP